MSVTATEFELQRRAASGAEAGTGPIVEATHWGYEIRDRVPYKALEIIGASAARFAGTLLLIAAAGLLVLPDGSETGGLVSMKLAALVVFTAFGLFLLLAGQVENHPELQVDITRAEVRIGRRRRGVFQPWMLLNFSSVSSVYLLRSKDRSRPARLFLRINGSDEAIEVASGPQFALEGLRERLATDLAHDPRQPAAPTRKTRPHIPA
jgi:hypothetical protein